MGGAGAGQVTKLANQVIVGETITAVAEAFLLAECAGVSPATLRQALRGGFADSRVLELHGDRMVRGDYEPGGRARAQLKDIREALALARQHGLASPALPAAVATWEELVGSGMGELDHSAMFAFLKQRGETST
jgi:2-hydroxy-3-oxopropionate reductase